MKLFFYFIAMDILTLLAYPILFVHGRLHRISAPNGIARPKNHESLLHSDPVDHNW